MSYLGHSLMSHYIFAAAGMEYWALFERWEPFRVPEDCLWENTALPAQPGKLLIWALEA